MTVDTAAPFDMPPRPIKPPPRDAKSPRSRRQWEAYRASVDEWKAIEAKRSKAMDLALDAEKLAERVLRAAKGWRATDGRTVRFFFDVGKYKVGALQVFLNTTIADYHFTVTVSNASTRKSTIVQVKFKDVSPPEYGSKDVLPPRYDTGEDSSSSSISLKD